MRSNIPNDRADLRALAALFTKLGRAGFGGPAARIALMREESFGAEDGLCGGGGLVPWIRRTPPARASLDGVNAGSVALMAVVTWALGQGALTTPLAWAITLLTLALVLAGINSAWLVAGGALAGVLLH